MEIINNYIGCTIFLLSVYLFGRIVFEKREKNKKIYNIVVFFIGSLIYASIVFLLDGTLKTILSCIVFTLMFKLTFNVGYGKALLFSIVYSIITIIPDLLLLGITTKMLNISKDYCYSTLAGSVGSNLFVGAFMLAFTYLLAKPLKKLVNYNFPTNRKIILVSFLTLISLTIFFYSLINTFEFSDNITGNLIVIITLILILFYLFKQKVENESISKKYDDLLNVMKSYENDIEEQRIIFHETRNELMTIKCKINDKEKGVAIIEYIDSILGDKISSNMSKYSKFKYLPSNGMKGFFYYKFMEAEKSGIKVSVNISKKIENSFLGNLDTKDFKNLVRMIGVYLDNAIESSTNSEEKKLGIEIYLIKEDIEIIISNTFANDVNIDKIGIEKFTTKGKNHGHGLLLVKHILYSNSIFEANNEIKNNLYVQKLRVKNNANKDQNINKNSISSEGISK